MGIDWNAGLKAEAANLLNYFFFRTGDRDVAEELYSRTLELAWKKRSRFEPTRGTIGAWLIGIGRRVLADYRRRSPVVLPEEAPEVVDERAESPETTAIRACIAQTVMDALRELSSRQREVVSMKWGGAMTNKEIAESLGISESNVGTIASRAIRVLRERLREEERREIG